jgi:hypothetical protein
MRAIGLSVETATEIVLLLAVCWSSQLKQHKSPELESAKGKTGAPRVYSIDVGKIPRSPSLVPSVAFPYKRKREVNTNVRGKLAGGPPASS